MRVTRRRLLLRMNMFVLLNRLRFTAHPPRATGIESHFIGLPPKWPGLVLPGVSFRTANTTSKQIRPVPHRLVLFCFINRPNSRVFLSGEQGWGAFVVVRTRRLNIVCFFRTPTRHDDATGLRPARLRRISGVSKAKGEKTHALL